MAHVSASQFRDLCSSLRDSVASLTSALDREVPNEARILLTAMAELESASLKRQDVVLEARRRDVLKHARETLVSRGAPVLRVLLSDPGMEPRESQTLSLDTLETTLGLFSSHYTEAAVYPLAGGRPVALATREVGSPSWAIKQIPVRLA